MWICLTESDNHPRSSSVLENTIPKLLLKGLKIGDPNFRLEDRRSENYLEGHLPVHHRHRTFYLFR